MTDITKYKTVTLPIKDYLMLPRIAEQMLPGGKLSNSKVVSMLIRKNLNGKHSK
jgi:hypothetical protein